MLSISELNSHVEELRMMYGPKHQLLGNDTTAISHDLLKRVLTKPLFVWLVPHVEYHSLEKCLASIVVFWLLNHGHYLSHSLLLNGRKFTNVFHNESQHGKELFTRIEGAIKCVVECLLRHPVFE